MAVKKKKIKEKEARMTPVRATGATQGTGNSPKALRVREKEKSAWCMENVGTAAESATGQRIVQTSERVSKEIATNEASSVTKE